MPDAEVIANQEALLDGHRRTLAHLLRQAAAHGGLALAPPATANGIAEARAGIAAAKLTLRAAGIAVADAPGDIAGPDEAAGASAASPGQRAGGNQNVQVSGQGNIVNVIFGSAPEPPLPVEDLPPLMPTVELPDLFPIANNPIGRDAERDQLNAWYDALAQDHRGRFVFITARPGYGKRALLNTLVEDVREQRGFAPLARFWPTQRAAPDTIAALWDDDPLLDPAALALEAQIAAAWPNAARMGGRGWVRVVAQVAQALGRVPLPAAERLPDDPTALKALLRKVARSHGLALALEGLDDADDVWIELLRDLAPEIERDLPILIVATLTLPAPLESLPGAEYTEILHLAKTLRKEGRAELLWLDAVTLQDMASYCGPIDSDLARRLRQFSDGVPTIVESLWDEWRASGVVTQDEQGVWVAASAAGEPWIGGGLRDAPLRLLAARWPSDAPLTREQVDQFLGCAALEGPTFTVQAVARALGFDPDLVLELLDTYLLDDDDAPGLLADVGFVEIGEQPADQRPYMFRFAYPHLWHLWVRYGVADAQRSWLQGQLADALELVYHGATDQIAPRLVTLFTAAGQPARAEPYRRRTQHTTDLVITLWQIGMLERQARDAFDDARLFELRLQASWRLYAIAHYADGAGQARAAMRQAETWRDQLRIARAANSIGLNLLQHGDYAAARSHLERALAIYEQTLRPNHHETAQALTNLAAVLNFEHDYATARPLYERALAIYEQTLGPKHYATATCQMNLAWSLYRQRNYVAARPLYERALAIYEQTLGPNHHATASAQNNLAMLLEDMGEYAAAHPLFESALEILHQALGPTHPYTQITRENLETLLKLIQSDGPRNVRGPDQPAAG